MNFQSLAVVLVVAFSFAYAAWTLMPQALRAALARGLLRLPIPASIRQHLLASANANASTCGACSGCENKAPVLGTNGTSPLRSAQAQPLVSYPRKGS